MPGRGAPRWANYYRGRHILVTGASEGVGLELAKQLAAAGASVSLLSRSEGKLRAAEAACAAAAAAAPWNSEGTAARTVAVPADVTDEAAVVAAVAAAEEALGPVDMLMHCAGAAECGYFHDIDAAAHRRMMDLNYMGAVHAVHAVLPGMVKRRRGHLLAVASTLSLMGAIGYGAYCPSKFAVRGLMETLRNELQGTGVCVSICYPPDMDTPGYEREGRTKPIESIEVSGNDALYPPATVADYILAGCARGEWVTSNPRMDVHLLQDLTLGLVPRTWLRLPWVMLRCLLGPIICWIIAAQFDAIARRHAAARYARYWGQPAAAAGGGGESDAAAANGGSGKAQRAKRS